MSNAAVDLQLPPAPPPRTADKRAAILAAALRLISRLGLHNAPMSAVAREAGVAAGTLYLYFPSKEAMINALYLEVLQDRDRALFLDAPPTEEPATVEAIRTVWSALARWHLDHPDASNLITQCRASGILSDETRAIEQRMDAQGVVQLEAAVARGKLRNLNRYEFWALFAGPIYALVQMRDAGELAITDDVLRTTFDGVCRSVLPERELAPSA